MKPILITFTALSLIALVTQKVNAIPTPYRQQVTYDTYSQATPVDTALLAKTITGFLQSDRYQTESQILMSGKKQSFDFISYAQVKTIAQSDGKFRSEITFTRQGEQPKPPTLVISDGKQVSVYKPESKEYAITSYDNFGKSHDYFFIGMSSYLFLQIPSDARKILARGQLSDKEILQQIGFTPNSDLKADQRTTVEGESFYVYNYTPDKEGLTFSGFVQPQTATLKQLQISGKSEGLDILIAEKILNRTANPAVTPQTFTFSPPKGAKKVKSLSILPF
jgi:outer membrane lipoprotein-sorting protein